MKSIFCAWPALAFATLIGPSLLLLDADVAESAPRPNVVYILVDDLGYGDLGCYGQQEIKTPRLDELAADGVRFTQHYAGCTVCAPARCTLMTGLHTGHCTVRGNVDVLMRDDEVTVAKLLQKAGYATACVGKWGIGHPPGPADPHHNGFDHFYGYLSMWHAHNAYPEFLWRNGQRSPLRNKVRHPADHYKAGQAALTGVSTNKLDFAGDKFTEEALELLERTREHPDKPFFLFVSYTAPHANNEAPAQNAIGVEVPDLGAYAAKPWAESEKAKAAVISHTDRAVGQLVDKLDELGIADNTLVIFSSDNGPHAEGGVDPAFLKSGGPLRGYKRDLYEGGIRVPMIARWKGVTPAGSTSDHVCADWDILPTLAGLAGVGVPNEIDGISFAPTLTGGEQPEHDHLYWEFHEKSSKQAVRFGDWKAVRTAPSRPIELYSLADDIGEANNVADEHPDVVARAKALIESSRDNEEVWPLQDSVEEIPF